MSYNNSYYDYYGYSEGMLHDVVVAEFELDGPDTERSAADFRAIINWGDGNWGPGRIAPMGDTFLVYGSHAYSQVGQFELVVVIEDGPVATQALKLTATAQVGLSFEGGGPINIFSNLVGRKGIHFDTQAFCQDVHQGNHQSSGQYWFEEQAYSFAQVWNHYSGACAFVEGINWGDGNQGDLSRYVGYATGNTSGTFGTGDFEGWHAPGNFGWSTGWHGQGFLGGGFAPYSWSYAGYGFNGVYGSYASANTHWLSSAPAWGSYWNGHGWGWGNSGFGWGGWGWGGVGWAGYGWGGYRWGAWGLPHSNTNWTPSTAPGASLHAPYGYGGHWGGWHGYPYWGWRGGAYYGWWQDSPGCSGTTTTHSCSHSGSGDYHHFNWDTSYNYDPPTGAWNSEGSHFYSASWFDNSLAWQTSGSYQADNFSSSASHSYDNNHWGWWGGWGWGAGWWNSWGQASGSTHYESLPWLKPNYTWHQYDQAGAYSVSTTFGLDREILVAETLIHQSYVLPVLYGEEATATESTTLISFLLSDWGTSYSDVTARVDWGDGSGATSQAVYVTADNRLAIDASHTYSEEGRYGITILVETSGGASRVFSSVASIVDPDLAAAGRDILAAAQIDTGEILVATITDWRGDQERLRATIDWGDGTPNFQGQPAPSLSRGTLRLNPDTGALEVFGSHTYEEAGNYDLRVKIEDSHTPAYVVASTATVQDGWTFDSYQRTNGFSEGYREGFGQALVSPNTGGLMIAHELDFDISPGTAVGGTPMLVYNSDTVDVRPILEGVLANSPGQDVPSQIDVQLIWQGRDPQPWQTFETTGHVPGDSYLVAVQLEDRVEQSGLYTWTLQVRLHLPGEPELLELAVSGLARVVVNDRGDLNPEDPFDSRPSFGAGWGITSIDLLIVHENGHLLWVTGSGDSRAYLRQEEKSPGGGPPTVTYQCFVPGQDPAAGQPHLQRRHLR